MRILLTIYALPLSTVAWFMALAVPGWTLLMLPLRRHPRALRYIGRLCAALSAAAILYATVLDRSGNGGTLYLLPFHFLLEAKIQPEIYRAMLMNVLLFFPLGLSLPYAVHGIRRRPALWTLKTAACFSAGIEVCQLLFRLGRCETDDVLVNTLGAAVGAVSYLLFRCLYKE